MARRRARMGERPAQKLPSRPRSETPRGGLWPPPSRHRWLRHSDADPAEPKSRVTKFEQNPVARVLIGDQPLQAAAARLAGSEDQPQVFGLGKRMGGRRLPRSSGEP